MQLIFSSVVTWQNRTNSEIDWFPSSFLLISLAQLNRWDVKTLLCVETVAVSLATLQQPRRLINIARQETIMYYRFSLSLSRWFFAPFLFLAGWLCISVVHVIPTKMAHFPQKSIDIQFSAWFRLKVPSTLILNPYKSVQRSTFLYSMLSSFLCKNI